MAGLQGWVTPLRAMVVVVAGMLLVVSGVFLTGGHFASPCRDDLSISAHPQAFEFETSESTVMVTFADGEPFTVENTVELFVSVSDDDSSAAERVVWGADQTGEFPVEPGDTLQIDDGSIESFTLDAGDTVEVVWRGHERPLPPYCLNERDDHVVEIVYGRYVLP